MATQDTSRTRPHPPAHPHVSGRGVGVSRPPADGGISSPLPPPLRPGGSVPMDLGGQSKPPLTPNSRPLPRNPDDAA